MWIFQVVCAAALFLLLWVAANISWDAVGQRFFDKSMPTLRAMSVLLGLTAVGFRGWATDEEGFSFLLIDALLILCSTFVGIRFESVTKPAVIVGFLLMVGVAVAAFTEMGSMRKVQEYRGSVVKLQRVQGHGNSSPTNYLTLQNAQGERELAITGMPGQLGWLDVSNGPVPVRIGYIEYDTPWRGRSIGGIIAFEIVKGTTKPAEAPSSSKYGQGK